MVRKAVGAILLLGGGVWAAPVLQDLLTRAVAVRPARDYPHLLLWLLLAVGLVCLGATRWQRWPDILGVVWGLAGVFVLITSFLEPAVKSEFRAPAEPVTIRLQPVYDSQQSNVPVTRLKGRDHSVQLDPTAAITENHVQSAAL